MIIDILWFALGLILLIKGGDWFVDGASGIAKALRIPDLLIGATVVSIGTTLPEVMVSATSTVTGHGAMAYGNAVGSVICNTALIAALTLAIRPPKVNRKELFTPVLFFFIAAGIFVGTAYFSGSFTRMTGIILLVMFVIYMTMLTIQAFKARSLPVPESEEEEEEEKDHPMWLLIVMLVGGAALIAWGANLLVDHGVAIAAALGVPETVIALTFVALGTSLPELVTAITALAKGHTALSLGNICGANLFNLVLVAGLSITIKPFEFNPETFSTLTIGGSQIFSSLLVDTPLMLAVMGILIVPALVRNKLHRWQGFVLLALYVGFCIYQFFVL